MKDLTNISTDLFSKIRSRFNKISMGDESGALTTKPEEARFFDITYRNNGRDLGRVNLRVDHDSLTVIYDQNMTDGEEDDARQEWFDFLKELRQFARKNLLKFDTRDIAKSNLDKRDYQYLAQKTGENEMSESKLFGTSKTSYQDVGEAKLIVKHSGPINYNNPAGRTQRIESIYIENATGERFRYPHRHLNGARALAVHVANGGTPYDAIGSHISGLSEELSKLRQFKNYTHRSGVMAEALGDINERVAERIEAVKHEIHNLQKQSYYEQFAESFAPSESQEVPEEMVNSWVDALTIRTFNEELKSVFPYIYKLVSEKREGELNYEDLDLSEETECPDCGNNPCTCDDEEEVKEHSMFDEFEQTIDQIAALPFEEIGYDEVSSKDASYILRKMEAGVPMSEILDDFPELSRMMEVIAGERGLHPDDDFEDIEEILMNDLEDIAAQGDDFGDEPVESAEPSQSSITEEVLEFIASMYDRESGTFPRGEEGVKIAVEKRFGEQASQFAHYVVEKLSANAQPAVQEQPIEQVEQPVEQVQSNDELLRIRSLAGF